LNFAPAGKKSFGRDKKSGKNVGRGDRAFTRARKGKCMKRTGKKEWEKIFVEALVGETTMKHGWHARSDQVSSISRRKTRYANMRGFDCTLTHRATRQRVKKRGGGEEGDGEGQTKFQRVKQSQTIEIKHDEKG